MMTIKEIVMDHVARKIADRIYWYFHKPEDVTIGDIALLVNFYYDDEIVQMVKNDIHCYSKIKDRVKKLVQQYD